MSVAVPLVSTVATPAANASSTATRTLPRLGDRGDGVRALQRALIAAGVTVKGGADGVFGQSTLSAVKTFQTARGLVPSGELDPTTAFLLGLESAPALPKRGDRGPAVTALQNALLSAGITVTGGVDGIFGAGTTAAVATFQAARNLGSSGVLDVATGIALRIVPGTGTTPSTAAPSTTTVPTTQVPNTQAPTTPVPGIPALSVGQQGDAVRTLQRALFAAGIKVNGGADGVFGAATTAAVANYQRAMSIAATGVVDPLTAQFLGLVPSPAMPVFGDTGPAVIDLQNRLIEAGITVKGGADGAFGVATRVSIRAFQTARAIPVTGKIDLRTAVQLGFVPGLVTNQVPPTTPSSTTSSTPPVTTTSISVFPVLGPCWFSDTWGVPRAGGRRHEGVDIIARTGQPVYAVVDGTITRQFFDRPGSLGGNALRLTAADGTYFHYAHLSAFAEEVGLDTVVVTGQIIGYVGSTGSSSAPHLHFEYHPGGGVAVNPYPIVKAVDACRAATPPTTATTTTTTVAPNPTTPA
ncbi:MAG: peptidoglycan-binding protein [Acidimicrobiia bacterium]